MNELLRDMLRHREWADATQLTAVAAHGPAARDAAILHRLHHTIQVQRHFLSVVGGYPDERLPEVSVLRGVEDLVSHAKATHDWERTYVANVSDVALGRIVEVPLPGAHLRISLAQVLAQSAMHSQHHRAQNALRLRELGGEPPTTDLIVWYMFGRPRAPWENVV